MGAAECHHSHDDQTGGEIQGKALVFQAFHTNFSKNFPQIRKRYIFILHKRPTSILLPDIISCPTVLMHWFHLLYWPYTAESSELQSVIK